MDSREEDRDTDSAGEVIFPPGRTETDLSEDERQEIERLSADLRRAAREEAESAIAAELNEIERTDEDSSE
jgi:hypothetical protein